MAKSRNIKTSITSGVNGMRLKNVLNQIKEINHKKTNIISPKLINEIRTQITKYFLNEDDEKMPQDNAVNSALGTIDDELGKIAKDVENKMKDDAQVQAALKKAPELAKVANESISRKHSALIEGNDSAVIKEELTILFAASVAMAIPAIVKLIGVIIKKISVAMGGEGKVGEYLEHKGDHWHHMITDFVLKGLQLMPGFKKLPTDKQQKIANLVHTVIVASLAVASGAGAIKALSQGSNAMAGVEGALTAVKAGEIGVGTFLKASIAKILT
jgi:hypothetical protein